MSSPDLDALARAIEPPRITERPVINPKVTPVALVEERGKTHGEYTDHARITQAIKRVMHDTPNWSSLSDIQKETLEMTAHKMGRILAGNPNHKDHWDDIAGYNVLVSQRLP